MDDAADCGDDDGTNGRASRKAIDTVHFSGHYAQLQCFDDDQAMKSIERQGGCVRGHAVSQGVRSKRLDLLFGRQCVDSGCENGYITAISEQRPERDRYAVVSCVWIYLPSWQGSRWKTVCHCAFAVLSCVCVCECARERGREGKGESGGKGGRRGTALVGTKGRPSSFLFLSFLVASPSITSFIHSFILLHSSPPSPIAFVLLLTPLCPFNSPSPPIFIVSRPVLSCSSLSVPPDSFPSPPLTLTPGLLVSR